MRKKSYGVFILIISIVLLISCSAEKSNKTEEKSDIVEITIARFMKSADENSIKSFNDYLKKEGIPYRVKFIQYMEADEEGFITNYEEVKKLVDLGNQQKMAEVIADEVIKLIN